MLDAFTNVLFGKKKTSAEADKERSDDFVVVGQAPSDQDSDLLPSTHLFSKNPYGASFLEDLPSEESPKKQETHLPIMPLQDVPFVINSSLYASTKLEQIWQTIAQSLASLGSANPYREDYDFSLEKSVIAETSNK